MPHFDPTQSTPAAQDGADVAARPAAARAATSTEQAAAGVFVTLEGVDGAGKTTQCALVCAGAAALGREVVRLREPGGTSIGERIRAILLDVGSAGMDPTCELLLYEAARAQLVAQVIRPALRRGAVVVSDRFFDSTCAYQGHARGLGMGPVDAANRLACADVAPTRTILLDIDPAAGLTRAAQADGGPDRLELEGVAFQQRVRDGFAQVDAAEPIRVSTVDAVGSVEAVYERVRAGLADILPLPPYEQARAQADAATPQPSPAPATHAHAVASSASQAAQADHATASEERPSHA